MPETQPSYVIISPVRDEGHLLEETIQSMLGQTLPPSQWVLVDDGSTDDTGSIVDKYARTCPWITAVHRPDRGHRAPGTGVIDAFYDGFEKLKVAGWEFIVKLDGDLVLPPDYFENCLGEFRADPKLGIGGGVIGHLDRGAMRIEGSPLFHVRGATKIYRRECWEAIGGLLKAPGWDTVDELKANMLGWATRSFTTFPILQKRPTGATNSAWGNWVKNGRANYIAGYHPLFMLVKCLKRAAQRPYVIGGVALLFGYVHGSWKRLPRVPDAALIRYTRKQQLRKLLLRNSIWQ